MESWKFQKILLPKFKFFINQDLERLKLKYKNPHSDPAKSFKIDSSANKNYLFGFLVQKNGSVLTSGVDWKYILFKYSWNTVRFQDQIHCKLLGVVRKIPGPTKSQRT